MTGAGGVYVHVPFCRAKCAYCDFRSAPVGAAVPRTSLDAYLRALALEASRRTTRTPPAGTVYLGGGTPSLLPDDALGLILRVLHDHFDIETNAEITLEANPCDLADPERPARLAALGFTRLSVGVQSLHDPSLALLGRPHGAEAARRAVASVARSLPVSADLILGVPGRTAADFAAEAEELAALGARHLSLYLLSCPDGTPIERALREGRIATASGEEEADLLEAAHGRLADLGLPPYEVSNFARTAADRSRHNLGYWTRAPYLGLGPAAHSFDPARRLRSWNAPGLAEWADAQEAGRDHDGAETLTPEQIALETLFLGLRHAGGVDFAALLAESGLDVREKNAARIGRLVDGGLADYDGRTLRPTPALMRRADGVAGEFEL